MAPKKFVYAVTRRDFNHHTDKQGTLALIDVHADLESANAAAKAHLNKESAKAPDYDEELEEGENKDGGYEAQCWVRQSQRDNFKVIVKKMELKGNAGAAPNADSSAKAKVKKPAKRSKPDDDDDDDGDEEDAAEAKKPAKTSKKASIPDGKANALKGLKEILFTGTFDSMDRNTSIATAQVYGGEIVKKLGDADWIILGVKAGPNKLDEIAKKGLSTMNETEFLEMLQTGKPPKK